MSIQTIKKDSNYNIKMSELEVKKLNEVTKYENTYKDSVVYYCENQGVIDKITAKNLLRVMRGGHIKYLDTYKVNDLKQLIKERLKHTRETEQIIKDNTSRYQGVHNCNGKWLCLVDDLTLGIYEKQRDAAIVYDIAVTFLDECDKRKSLSHNYDITSNKISNIYKQLLLSYKQDQLNRKLHNISKQKEQLTKSDELLFFD